MNVQVCLQAKIFDFVKNTCFSLTKSYMKIKNLNKNEVASLTHELGQAELGLLGLLPQRILQPELLSCSSVLLPLLQAPESLIPEDKLTK